MKKVLAVLLLAVLLCSIAAAVGDADLNVLLQQYSARAVQEAEAILPGDSGLTLTDREAEIYRLGFARGYDAASGGTSATSAGSVDGTLVWIPTNGGTKYHISKTCRNMIDPVQVTVTEAQRLGYEPCGVCIGK
ncbi:MAG: hypothetical protein ACI4O7_08500 [Aristaeellaceae bacterium]